VTTLAYRRSPGTALATVAAGLDDLGLWYLYLSACSLVGVLSVAVDVTAWCDYRSLTEPAWQGSQ
jgi:hypothetical protein